MFKPKFGERLLAVLAGMVILAFLAVPGAFSQNRDRGEASKHNQQGMEYYEKGFYDHTPKNQAVEAERNYGLAIREFRAAISKDPSNTEAHRNLARVYFVQKNFQGAAEQYKRVTELTPGDLDAYVHLALTLIELQRFDEAIQTLENAKQQTSDSIVLEKLDSYIAKIRARQAEEVK
jgi:tetratricopeptide (TPR) repeat protein